MESIESADDEQMESNGGKACWVTITCGPNKHIALAAGSREEIDAIHERGGVLRCIEAYEFGCPIQMKPERQGFSVGKIHYSTRLDSTLHKCPVQFSLMGASLYYLDDLSKNGGDHEQYMLFIKNARLSAQHAADSRISKTSRIQLASPGDLSNLGGFGGRG